MALQRVLSSWLARTCQQSSSSVVPASPAVTAAFGHATSLPAQRPAVPAGVGARPAAALQQLRCWSTSTSTSLLGPATPAQAHVAAHPMLRPLGAAAAAPVGGSFAAGTSHGRAEHVIGRPDHQRPVLLAAAAGRGPAMQHLLSRHHPQVWPRPSWQQQQLRGLLGGKKARGTVNRQNHRPKVRFAGRKMKTPSLLKHRFILTKDGEYRCNHAGRRHGRHKKRKSGALKKLKRPHFLFKTYANKLKKLGYKRTWWYMSK